MVNDKVLVVANGGYRLIDPLESRNLQSLPTLKLPGISMIGKPTIHGNELYVTHRAGGEVWMLDISDLRKPKLMNQFETRAIPAAYSLIRIVCSFQVATKVYWFITVNKGETAPG